ncbi:MULTISPECIES: carbohydrate ABC transporter permease [unclassified Paenibacillus]|uniref:carbohydrate ABC transporter permease n=1 Tax=unclassified Paenibacillus TaxID=185978 RepID=UPI002786430E|nr:MULTISPECIES: sugar ABC transporter permease [unclassified Paenibacillus]MDQ0900503.1 multiple sugar transport system permease protein [Paenibacillus sp. V4I7]MDQ0920988.1 multiple sugar transport system permease protein [Paenibacillus sp. V4I5]
MAKLAESVHLKASPVARKQRSFRRTNVIGWLFASPWALGLICFYAIPMFASIYFSFTTYSILQPGEFVGLNNYKDLFNDPLFWKSIYNTIYFAVFFVPISIFFGVALAMMLNLKVKGMAIYRTIFFLPTLVPQVALAVLWMWLLHPNFGLVNGMLASIGIDGPPWLGGEAWSKPSLILMSLWGIGHAVVIYLAGLGDIPDEYYEAAEIDGANWFQKTKTVTLPLLTPVIFYNLVMGTIGAFQQFTLPYTMTKGQGTPANSMTFYVMYLYENGFRYFKMGYASAMAWILFVIVMALTALIFISSKRWVHYQGK